MLPTSPASWGVAVHLGGQVHRPGRTPHLPRPGSWQGQDHGPEGPEGQESQASAGAGQPVSRGSQNQGSKEGPWAPHTALQLLPNKPPLSHCAWELTEAHRAAKTPAPSLGCRLGRGLSTQAPPLPRHPARPCPTWAAWTLTPAPNPASGLICTIQSPTEISPHQPRGPGLWPGPPEGFPVPAQHVQPRNPQPTAARVPGNSQGSAGSSVPWSEAPPCPGHPGSARTADGAAQGPALTPHSRAETSTGQGQPGFWALPRKGGRGRQGPGQATETPLDPSPGTTGHSSHPQGFAFLGTGWPWQEPPDRCSAHCSHPALPGPPSGPLQPPPLPRCHPLRRTSPRTAATTSTCCLPLGTGEAGTGTTLLTSAR